MPWIIPPLPVAHPGHIPDSVRRNVEILYARLPMTADSGPSDPSEYVGLSDEEIRDLDGIIGGYMKAVREYDAADMAYRTAKANYDSAVASGNPGQITSATNVLDAAIKDRVKKADTLRTTKHYLISRVDSYMEEYVTWYRLRRASQGLPVPRNDLGDVQPERLQHGRAETWLHRSPAS